MIGYQHCGDVPNTILKQTLVTTPSCAPNQIGAGAVAGIQTRQAQQLDDMPRYAAMLGSIFT